nr:MBL fold metallo-hydrolase [Candidatus Cloacimonadota bacterium]
GITYKKANELTQDLQIDLSELDGIIISHEHSDHVGGAGVLSRKTKAPIFISAGTLDRSLHKLGKLPVSPYLFIVGESFQIKNLVINPFTSSHDAIDSCNFLLYNAENEEKKLAIATDLGYAPQILINKLKQATTVILESNHDMKMLMEGPYEWHLKQRIKSNVGHLSNEQAVGVISQIISERLERIVLAHLSEINNCPKIAFNTMINFLTEIQVETKLSVASQYHATPLYDV